MFVKCLSIPIVSKNTRYLQKMLTIHAIDNSVSNITYLKNIFVSNSIHGILSSRKTHKLISQKQIIRQMSSGDSKSGDSNNVPDSLNKEISNSKDQAKVSNESARHKGVVLKVFKRRTRHESRG